MMNRALCCLLSPAIIGLVSAVLSLSSCGGSAPESTVSPPQSTLPLGKISDGYTGRASYAPGEQVDIFANSPDTGQYSLVAYDLNGHPFSLATAELFPQTVQSDAPWSEGFGYKVSARFLMPDIPSGLYLVNQQIPVIVRNKSAMAMITVVYPTNTINAYNIAGGKSLYHGAKGFADRATKVSILRPVNHLIEPTAEGCMRWFASIGYDVQYISDIDLENFANFADSRVLVIVGHSEYWTRQARRNFDQFVDRGGNAVILSGNTMWWQARLGKARDSLIVYKDATLDPIKDPLGKTITWNNPSLQYPIITSIGADYAHGGYGQKSGRSFGGFKVVAHDSPIFAGTGLQDGDVIPLVTDEYDGAPLLGYAANGIPELDTNQMLFHNAQLLAFDRGFRDVPTTGTFLALRKSPQSGFIFNVGSMNWCGLQQPFSGTGTLPIWKITRNMIDAALSGNYAFPSD